MRSTIDLLVADRKGRVSFEDLKISELRELAHHMRKEPWVLLRDALALKAAVAMGDGENLSERLTNLQSQIEVEVKPIPINESEVRNQIGYLAALTSSGYRSLYEARTRIAALDTKIEEKEKQRSNSIKIPFMDQPIDASTLAWVIPTTLAIGTLFCVFYVMRARELYGFSARIDRSAARAKLMYPWIYLSLPEQNTFSRYVARFLQIAIIGAPIVASLVFLLRAISSSSTVSLMFIFIANLLAITCAAAFMYELAAFRSELGHEHERPGEGVGREAATH